MRYTITIREDDYAALRDVTFAKAPDEGSAYLLCGESRTDEEVRLLVREVIPVLGEDYSIREPTLLSIRSQSYAFAAKRANATGAGIFFVHSHPDGHGRHSPQDDREEPRMLDFFSSRVPDRTHGSIVLSDAPELSARIWKKSRWVPVELVRILGKRFRFIYNEPHRSPITDFFDRQVRAFGTELQSLLGRLHVGIVGAGGTGSAVGEQLTRLGVGTISIFDHDVFESSNANRVYGSRISNQGENKALIASKHLEGIGLGTRVNAYPSSITEEAIARSLRACDIIFGCTDVEAPRAILVALALRYLIPVVDMGVRIDAPQSTIKSIDGRITVLTPGERCLFCRGRISPETIRLESLAPEERAGLEREGYAPHLDTRDPAVITFTTAVAAYAVSELLNRLTGAIRGNSDPEHLLLFHMANGKVIHPAQPWTTECGVCGQPRHWGMGDTTPFLGQVWGTS